jgi:hypothetical protein
VLKRQQAEYVDAAVEYARQSLGCTYSLDERYLTRAAGSSIAQTLCQSDITAAPKASPVRLGSSTTHSVLKASSVSSTVPGWMSLLATMPLPSFVTPRVIGMSLGHSNPANDSNTAAC